MALKKGKKELYIFSEDRALLYSDAGILLDAKRDISVNGERFIMQA